MGAGDSNLPGGQPTRPRAAESPSVPLADPRVIVTFNANGLIARAKKDSALIKEFVTTHDPDLICIQVRCDMYALYACRTPPPQME